MKEYKDLSKLIEELKKKDFSSISKKDYVQNYLNSYLKNIDEIINYYIRLIYLAGDISNKTIVDIGCGFGIFAIVAKKCGAKKVIAIDQDEYFYDAAKTVSSIMDISIDVRLLSAEEIETLKDEDIDVAFSSCFIEHVYDLKAHFKNVYNVLNEKGIYVAETVLNSLNPQSIIKKRPIHKKAEYSGSEAYFNKRKEFIILKFNKLSEKEIDFLATKLSRFAKDDLITKIDNYLISGKLRNIHFDILFNTCEPNSGYWPDKLMNPFIVKKYSRIAGFQSHLSRPIRNWRKIYFPRTILRYAKNMLNSILPLWIVYLYTPSFICLCKKQKVGLIN